MTEDTDFSRFLEKNDSDELSVPEHLEINAEEALARMEEQTALQSAAELSQLESNEQEEIVQDSVSRLSDNVREEAVEIARDILNKLKITLGSALLEDGIHLKVLDKEDVFGMINQVKDVFEYLVASARALDEELLENAIIYNAIVAMDRLHHAVLADQLTRAQHSGNMQRASELSKQLEKMPQHAKNMEGTFGNLLNKIDNGIKLIMQQLQQRGTSDAIADNWRGLTNYSTINGRDTEDDQREKRNIKNMEHIERREAIAAKKAAHLEAQQAARVGQTQSSRESAKLTQQQQSRESGIRAKLSALFGKNWLSAFKTNQQVQQQQQQIQVQMNIKHLTQKNVKIQQEVMNDVRRGRDKNRSQDRNQRIDKQQDLRALDAQLKDIKRDAASLSDVGPDFDPSKEKKDLDPKTEKKFTDRFR